MVGGEWAGRQVGVIPFEGVEINPKDVDGNARERRSDNPREAS